MEQRRKSSFDDLDLDGIETPTDTPKRAVHEIDASSTLPSREPTQLAGARRQLNFSLLISDHTRFDGICKRAGKPKAVVLREMMDLWESQGR